MSKNPFGRTGISAGNAVSAAKTAWESATTPALRIRWAARLACARLRVEVAELRCDRARLLSGCGWIEPEIRAERDRARRVLERLEKSDG